MPLTPLLLPGQQPPGGSLAPSSSMAPDSGGHYAVLRLSWGVLQCLNQQQQQQGGAGGGAGAIVPPPGEEARKPLLDGAASGAFAFLRQV